MNCKNASRSYTPLTCSFPSVDSILYDPNDPKAVLTCIQITRNMEHIIAVSGLRLIQSWLKLKTPPSDFRPSEKRPWRFVFVVPRITFNCNRLLMIPGTPRRAWPIGLKKCSNL